MLTSPAKLARVLAATPSHVGVSTLTDNDTVVAVRPPSDGLGRIDRSALFRVLRRDELLNILARRLGYEQDVPNTRIYRRLNGLFMQLDVETAYHEFVTELARRDQRKRQAARDAGLPVSLRAAAAGLSLTPTSWRRLGALLHRPAEEFLPPGRIVAAG